MPRAHAPTEESTAMRSPHTATREQPLLATTREKVRAATKTQYRQKFFKLDKGIMKTKAEMWEIATKKTTAKINKTKSWLSEKINKIDKPFHIYHKRGGRGKRTQINKIWHEKREIKTDTVGIQRIIKTTASNSMRIKWTAWRNGRILGKV